MVTRAFLLQVKMCVAVFGISHNAALGSLQTWCSVKELMEVAYADHKSLVWKSLTFQYTSDKKAVFSKKLPNTTEKKTQKVTSAIWVLLFSKTNSESYSNNGQV